MTLSRGVCELFEAVILAPAPETSWQSSGRRQRDRSLRAEAACLSLQGFQAPAAS